MNELLLFSDETNEEQTKNKRKTNEKQRKMNELLLFSDETNEEQTKNKGK
jgi:hypothetical protein